MQASIIYQDRRYYEGRTKFGKNDEVFNLFFSDFNTTFIFMCNNVPTGPEWTFFPKWKQIEVSILLSFVFRWESVISMQIIIFHSPILKNSSLMEIECWL